MSLIKAIVVFLVHLAYATHCHLPAASCPNVPSASVDAVCRAAAGEEFMYELCLNAMRDVSEPKNEVSLYALVAAKHAQASYDNTEQALGGLLGSVSLPGERDAYVLCAEKYQEAGGTMGAVSDMAGRRRDPMLIHQFTPPLASPAPHSTSCGRRIR